MPDNVPVDIVDALINGLLEGIGTKEAYALLVAEIPFLGWGPIGWVVGLLVGWVGSYVFKALAKLVVFKVIDWETIAQNAAYQAAVTQLKNAQVANDPAAIATASQDFKDTLQKLIQFNGS